VTALKKSAPIQEVAPRVLRSARSGKSLAIRPLWLSVMENKKLNCPQRAQLLRTHHRRDMRMDKLNQKHRIFCCGTPMRSFGRLENFNPAIESIQRWVCEVCGHGIDVAHFDLDELTLQAELRSDGDLASPFNTHQMKGGMG